jgi:hypothetical protein
MDVNGDYIRLTGLQNVLAVEEAIDRNCIDILYVDAIVDNTITLVVDVGIDLSKEEDREWLGQILSNTLKECDETQAVVEMIAGR